jgi:hypothetical protein
VEAAATVLGEYVVILNAIRDSKACIKIEMVANTGADQHVIKMRVPSMDIAHQAEGVITQVILSYIVGNVGYTIRTITEGHRTIVMEGDTIENILKYLHTGEVVNVTLEVKGMNTKARDMHNSKEIYEMMSQKRLLNFIKMLQETKVKLGEYTDTVVANDTYNVVTAVQLIGDNHNY